MRACNNRGNPSTYNLCIVCALGYSLFTPVSNCVLHFEWRACLLLLLSLYLSVEWRAVQGSATRLVQEVSWMWAWIQFFLIYSLEYYHWLKWHNTAEGEGAAFGFLRSVVVLINSSHHYSIWEISLMWWHYHKSLELCSFLITCFSHTTTILGFDSAIRATKTDLCVGLDTVTSTKLCH